MPVDLSELSSFRTTATAKTVYFLQDEEQLYEIAERVATTPLWMVLGEGSNVLFVGDYAGMVVVNRLRGIEINTLDSAQTTAAHSTVRVTVAAGENWHQLVLQMSQSGYYGLENLALIPGSVGAAPVQNIGAYGVEVADFIESVTVFDLSTQTTQTLAAADCGFAYRNSHFKRPDWRSRYIIIAVTFRLSQQFNPVLTYQGLQEHNTPTPHNAEQLIARIIDVRQSKLPDPAVLPNAGSFFKNPLISYQQLQQLQVDYPMIPSFPVDAETVKVPAAWLLQSCGFKGKNTASGAGVYEHHALILVNRGGASGKSLWMLAKEMIDAVQTKFSITLSPEVRIISSLSG